MTANGQKSVHRTNIMDPPVLSYGDCVLRESDVRLLDDGNWLNDTLIEFVYEYLERSHDPKSLKTAFVRPAIIHLLAHATDTAHLEAVVGGLNLHTKEIIFIPINDNEGAGAGGGHWSLMVYHRPTDAFYYYDSMGKYNVGTAKRTKERLYPVISHARAGGVFYEVDTPPQINGYDCGVYVIAITDLLARRFFTRGFSAFPEKVC
ncbi:SUMO1 sentrin specific peptidase 8 [Irineochytrium annulatum]|nr:SUMO1 sentrin specific peptidase 8 [Irineochytrium annulatum]